MIAYTGCDARLTAEVMECEHEGWRVVVHKQNFCHNHPTAPPTRTPEQLLHSLVQIEGNHAAIIQDKQDVVGMAIHTNMQAKCFAEWGDCLAIDWTRGAGTYNNTITH